MRPQAITAAEKSYAIPLPASGRGSALVFWRSPKMLSGFVQNTTGFVQATTVPTH